MKRMLASAATRDELGTIFDELCGWRWLYNLSLVARCFPKCPQAIWRWASQGPRWRPGACKMLNHHKGQSRRNHPRAMSANIPSDIRFNSVTIRQTIAPCTYWPSHTSVPVTTAQLRKWHADQRNTQRVRMLGGGISLAASVQEFTRYQSWRSNLSICARYKGIVESQFNL